MFEMEPTEIIRDKYLEVHFYKEVIDTDSANRLYNDLIKLFDGNEKQRTAILFGNDGLVYTSEYWYKVVVNENGSEKRVYGKEADNSEWRSVVSKREVNSWGAVPRLKKFKDYIERLIDCEISVCLVQLYPDGNADIKPHRDKEMGRNLICGISLGATRKIRFSRTGFKSRDIYLPNGSMYVMMPPTNTEWKHSIPKERNVTKARISLTFRNYK